MKGVQKRGCYEAGPAEDNRLSTIFEAKLADTGPCFFGKGTSRATR